MILRSLIVTVIAVAGLVLAGCGGSGGGSDDAKAPDPTPTPSATRATIDPTEPACALLTARERTKLVGSTIDEVSATGGGRGSSRCRWQNATSLIEVTTLPAQAWAKTLPDVVGQLEKSADLTSSNDKRDLARARKLLAGADTFTAEQACAAFTTLAEIGGGKDGTRTTVTYVPISASQTGISAQTCSGGALTSVIYAVPGLTKSAKVEQAAKAALAAAQKRITAS